MSSAGALSAATSKFAFFTADELYAPERRPGLILKAGCFAHPRRKFFELADVEGAARKKSRGEKAGIIYPRRSMSPISLPVPVMKVRVLTR